MKRFISKWSSLWLFNPKREQLDEAFEKELNELIEREVALRQICNHEKTTKHIMTGIRYCSNPKCHKLIDIE